MCRLITQSLSLLVIAACLAGCAYVSPGLVVPERINYTVPRPSESKFVFERYLDYAQQLAAGWDDHARLHSIWRQTRCDVYEQVAGQKLLVRFWRPTQYWFGQRIEWFEVSELPEDSDSTIFVWTSSGSTWDKPPIDLTSVRVSYADALELSLDRGGAEFIASYPLCYMSAGIEANQWLFVYAQDRWQAKGEPLKICIDGRTGEPCEFPSERGWLEQQP